MARVKTGLEYFSVDVAWDTKMKLMKAKYGLEGVGLIIELYKTIYQEGYYYLWNEETRLLFAAEHNIDEIPLSEMVHFAIGKGLFDIGKWKKDSILTSSGIQKRYLQASLKRKEVVFHKDFLLIEPKIPEWCKTKLIINSKKPILISESVEKDSETPLSDSSSTQSKVKESKVKKILKKEVIPKTEPSAETSVFKKAQVLMEEIHGDTYLNYKKEAPCLKTFIDQLSKKAPDDPWKVIEAMIYQFAEMKQHDRTVKGYWREMDFAPNKLLANAEIIYEKLKQRTKEEKLTSEDKELIKRLWGGG